MCSRPFSFYCVYFILWATRRKKPAKFAKDPRQAFGLKGDQAKAIGQTGSYYRLLSVYILMQEAMSFMLEVRHKLDTKTREKPQPRKPVRIENEDFHNLDNKKHYCRGRSSSALLFLRFLAINLCLKFAELRTAMFFPDLKAIEI